MSRALVLAVSVLLALPCAASAATFTVTSSDNVDDGTCDGAHCSLREAIDDANANGAAVTDEIAFSGPTTVQPAVALPSITTPVVVNGSNAPACAGTGFAQVALEGNVAAFDGLHLAAGSDGSRVCRLNIRGFDEGIVIDSDDNTVDLCRIGTDPTAESADPNSGDGITVDDGNDNTITGNVLSGNSRGLQYVGTTTGNVATANMIGTDKDGATAIPNTIGVAMPQFTEVTLGGTTAAARNVISGNTSIGVMAGSGNVIGNYIGIDATGELPLGNGTNGVEITAPPAVIGGSAPGSRNVISANDNYGVQANWGGTIEGNWIGPSATGAEITSADQDNGVTVELGTATVEDNVIAGHSTYGIDVLDTNTGSTIRDNVIGLAPNGLDVRAANTGIVVRDGVTQTLVQGNTIAGNSNAGIRTEAFDTTIAGNTIGLDAAGAATPLTANANALRVQDPATSTFIGGNAAGAGNRLANSTDEGVLIESGATTMQANLVDGNATVGVAVQLTGAAVIGGNDAASANTITQNGTTGVDVLGTGVAALRGNSIHANGSAADHLGIDLGGTGLTPNDAGDVDPGPNHLQNAPVLTRAETDGTTTAVEGTLDTTPGHDITVEVFASDACDASGAGEGQTFLGRVQLVAGTGSTPFTLAVAGTPAGRAITATATDDDLGYGETSEFSACFTATQKPDDPDPDPGTPPPDMGTAPPPPGPIVPLPIVVPPAPKFPAKLAVLRNGVDDGVLDMLIQVTSRSVTPGAVLELDYNSSGRHTRFTVPITSTQIKVRKKLPKSQPKDTGIVEIEYDGNDLVNPDSVRLRAADGKSKLVRSKSSVTNGKLAVEGTIAKAARGVVRIRLEFDRPDGTTGTLFWNVKIAGGKWKLSETLPTEAARGGQLSIQFTGYEKENLRGEQAAKQVLA